MYCYTPPSVSPWNCDMLLMNFLSSTIFMGMKVAHPKALNEHGDSRAPLSLCQNLGSSSMLTLTILWWLLPFIWTLSSFWERRMVRWHLIILEWARNIHHWEWAEKQDHLEIRQQDSITGISMRTGHIFQPLLKCKRNMKTILVRILGMNSHGL